jgi:hypothetical protein
MDIPSAMDIPSSMAIRHSRWTMASSIGPTLVHVGVVLSNLSSWNIFKGRVAGFIFQQI